MKTKMKVEVINKVDYKEEKTFPKLMATEKGKVVLFYEHAKGVLLAQDANKKQPVGHYSSSWYMGAFADFEGSITLSND